MDFVLIGKSGGQRQTFTDVVYVETPTENVVRLADSGNRVIAVVHLAPGERIERN